MGCTIWEAREERWSIGLTTLLVLAYESLIRAEFSRSAWLSEAELESHRHRE